jgi:hypothetical protein
VEGVRKFSDATIGPRGGCVGIGGALHIEGFMRTLVVKLANESVELGLLLKEVGTGWACSFHLACFAKQGFRLLQLRF